jgi:hypothetical protein
MGRGIQVNLLSGAALFDALLYGYEGSFSFGVEYFRQRKNILENEWIAAEKNLKETQGVIIRLLEKNESMKVMSMIQACQASAMRSGQAAGAMGEAEKYTPNGDKFADRGIFETAAAQAQTDGENKRVEMHRLAGQVEYVWNAWYQSKSINARQQLSALVIRYIQAAYDTGALHGAYAENISYILKCDDLRQAAGAWQAPAKILQEVA